MIFTASLLVLALFFAWVQWRFLTRRHEIWAGLFVCTFGVIVFFSLVIKVAQETGAPGLIGKYEATRTTVEQARLNGVDLENAAIQTKIIEMNQWLGETQALNQTAYEWWVPDVFDELEPIR